MFLFKVLYSLLHIGLYKLYNLPLFRTEFEPDAFFQQLFVL